MKSDFFSTFFSNKFQIIHFSSVFESNNLNLFKYCCLYLLTNNKNYPILTASVYLNDITTRINRKERDKKLI